MDLQRTGRRAFLRACWMAGTALAALGGGGTSVLAQETTSYSYDALGRLASTSTSGGTNNGVVTGTCFDSAGNRTQYVVGAAGAPCTTPAPSPTPTPTPTPTNSPPVAVADATSFHCSLFKTVDLIANDSDPDNNVPLQLVSVTSLDPHLIWSTSSTSTSVTLASAQAGTYSLSYVLADSLGATSTGTLTATVTGNTNCKEPPLE